MTRSTIFGSALGVLLVLSVISYSKTFIQKQNPKPAPNQQPAAALEVAGQVPEGTGSATPAEGPLGTGTSPDTLAGNRSEAPASTASNANLTPPTVSNSSATAQTYTATAYSLRGRTASGKPVSRGLIAADPSFLPLGTRVRVEAGSWSGEYLVADTGDSVKGRRIDIWTPTAREAHQFGRRPVKLTVLELGSRHGKAALVRPRRVNDSAAATAPVAQTVKQDK